MNRKTTEEATPAIEAEKDTGRKTARDPMKGTVTEVDVDDPSHLLSDAPSDASSDVLKGAAPLQQELTALKQDVTQMRKDLADLSSAIRTLAGEKVASSRETVAESARKGKDELQKQLEQALSAGRKSVSDLESRIDQQPLASVLTAAAVGYVVARLLGHSGHSGKVDTEEKGS